MKDFIFQNPTKVIFGKGSMSKLSESINPFGRKILLIYGGGSIKKNGIYSTVLRELSEFDVREFSGIEPNPRVETIRVALNKTKGFDPDFVLAVGGGSVIDATKLYCSAYHYKGDPWDFLKNPDANPTRYIPFGVVLTISATGSEMNCGSVISKHETNEKTFFKRREIFPKFSIIDPENQYSLPKNQTAYGIVDAYSHVLEQYIHNLKDVPLQNRFSEGIMLTLIENAKPLLNDLRNYTYRSNVILCATMALNNVIRMGTNEDWATHMIEHELSAYYDIPHGLGLAIITPKWMEVVIKQKIEKLAHYGMVVWGLTGSTEDVAKQSIKKTFDFFKSLGIPMSLSAINIDKEHFESISTNLAKNKIGEIPLTKVQIFEILNKCL